MPMRVRKATTGRQQLGNAMAHYNLSGWHVGSKKLSTFAQKRPMARSCNRPRALVIEAVVTELSKRDVCFSALMLGSVHLATWLGTPASALARLSVVDVDKAGPGERDVLTMSTGVKYSQLYDGKGDTPKTGEIVMVDVVGTLEDGKLFIDTKELGSPLTFQIGTYNKYVPEGLSQLVENMHSGGRSLAVIPSSLGFGEREVRFPQGSVPPGSKLFYEVELLRCQTFPIGIACCPDEKFPCIKDGESFEMPIDMGGQ